MNNNLSKEDISRKDFFYCFDMRLSNFLNRQGFRHLVDAIHRKSDKRFNLYFRTDELTKAIDAYQEERKRNSNISI